MEKKIWQKCRWGVAIILLILLFSVLLAGCSTTEELQIPEVKEDVYIYDQDDIIDDSVEHQLNEMLVDLEEKTGVEFAVISIESLDGFSIETYANKMANSLGIGKASEDNGLLLLISESDEKVRLEIGKGLEGCLNDSKCGRILDNYFVPYRESNQYTEATAMTTQAVLNVIAEEYGIEIQGLDNSVSLEEDSNDALLFWIIILIIIIIFLAIVCYSGYSGGGYYSGGSFGGSSFGGGSFGGSSFGGGSFGGGGASR